MMQPVELFDSSLEWLQLHYAEFPFVVERDIVWTLWQHISAEIKRGRLPYTTHTDYPMLPGNRRSLCADLAILHESGKVAVAAEFKYEPSRQRSELLPSKFPVVFWATTA